MRDYNSMRDKRLRLIKDHLLTGFEDLLGIVLNSGFVTDRYDAINLKVDLWYFNRRKYPSFTTTRNVSKATDPEANILFQTVVEALLDFRTGRPCDIDAWRCDLPPDNRRCVDSEHRCIDHAEEYLLGISSTQEAFMNLSPGTIRRLMYRIKKDPNFIFGSIE